MRTFYRTNHDEITIQLSIITLKCVYLVSINLSNKTSNIFPSQRIEKWALIRGVSAYSRGRLLVWEALNGVNTVLCLGKVVKVV